MTATLTPRPRQPQPHPATYGWKAGQGVPPGYLEAMRRWLGPPPTTERITALEAFTAAKPYREEVKEALILAFLALTGNLEGPAGEGLAWKDWANLTPADWPAHDRRMALIREMVATPQDERTPAQLAALRGLPARYERLFSSWDLAQAASDGLAVNDPDVEDSPDLELARRRVAGRASSKLAS